MNLRGSRWCIAILIFSLFAASLGDVQAAASEASISPVLLKEVLLPEQDGLSSDLAIAARQIDIQMDENLHERISDYLYLWDSAILDFEPIEYIVFIESGEFALDQEAESDRAYPSMAIRVEPTQLGRVSSVTPGCASVVVLAIGNAHQVMPTAETGESGHRPPGRVVDVRPCTYSREILPPTSLLPFPAAKSRLRVSSFDLASRAQGLLAPVDGWSVVLGLFGVTTLEYADESNVSHGSTLESREPYLLPPFATPRLTAVGETSSYLLLIQVTSV